jgi:hypothetical protein
MTGEALALIHLRRGCPVWGLFGALRAPYTLEFAP